MVQTDRDLAEASPGQGSQTPSALEDEFDAFFDDTYPLLVKIAMAVGASFHEAEEAASETMEYVYRRRSEIGNLRAFARRVVVTTVTKVKKRDGERLARTIAGCHVTPQADDGTEMTAWEDAEWVRQQMAALPPTQRQVMALVVDSTTPTEIAEILGKTPATIRKNLQLAREHLKAELEKEHRLDQPAGGNGANSDNQPESGRKLTPVRSQTAGTQP